MKKALQATMFLAITSMLTAPAFADGLVFDPVGYPGNSAYTTTSPYIATSEPVSTVKSVNTAATVDIADTATREKNSLQNALFQIDTAQVDIRNQLLESKAKYSEIDTQYKLIKEQRKAQKKLVKTAEKKIKSLEKSKNQIRKNMATDEIK